MGGVRRGATRTSGAPPGAARRWSHGSQNPGSNFKRRHYQQVSAALNNDVQERWAPAFAGVTTVAQSGTYTVSLMCLRLATIVKVMITSSDHELHLPRLTIDQAPSWFG